MTGLLTEGNMEIDSGQLFTFGRKDTSFSQLNFVPPCIHIGITDRDLALHGPKACFSLNLPGQWGLGEERAGGFW